MKKYLVTMFNTVKGKTEKYETKANDRAELDLSLSLFLENGYELLSLEERGDNN